MYIHWLVRMSRNRRPTISTFLGSADGLENPIQQLGHDETENRKTWRPKGHTQKLNLPWYHQKLYGSNFNSLQGVAIE